jgi:tRNA-dihydrouridine synthase A
MAWPTEKPDRRLCVAPMMDWTDRYDRYFLRQISRHALLYSEMVTTGALIHGDRERFLRFHAEEHPVAIQLGGSNPQELAQCAAYAQEWAYDEVNLNIGCPSDRVQAGRIGACLMAEPALVAQAVVAMRAACDLPITVKTRIGIDDLDSYAFLHDFVNQVAVAGCTTFIVHARKAILSGLSPKQNREIPPLKYDVVYRLKSDFPELEIILNGGVTELATATAHLQQVDGVMLGRAAYQNPYLLATVDSDIYGDCAEPVLTRLEIVARMLPFIQSELARGVPLKSMTRHMLGLYQGQPSARSWRRVLSEEATSATAGIEVIRKALTHVEESDQVDPLFQNLLAA